MRKAEAQRPTGLRSRLKMYCAAAVLLLLLVCPFVQAQQSPAEGMPAEQRQELAQAEALYQQGQAKEAEDVLRNLLRRYPRNEAANATLGLIYAEQGTMERALPYLSLAAQSPASTAADHANLGAALLKLGRFAAALPELKTAARLDPDNADTASELGQAYMLNHDPKHGAAAFSAAAGIAPPNADLLYNWALALSETGEAKQAAATLARIPPAARSAQACSLAGDVQEKLGNYMAAVQNYQNAAAKDPSEENLYALAVEFLRHWTWAEALKVSEFARTKYPESARIQLALGIAYYGSGQYPASARIFSSLLHHDPENSSYADLLGRSCGNISEGQSTACSQLIAFAEHHPQNAYAALYAAENILHQPGEPNLNHAERLLKNAITADPNLPDAYYQMGVLDQQRLAWRASVAMLEKAIAMRPSFASAHYRLARAYARLGKPGKADEEIALQRKYNQQETTRLDTDLKSISIFLPASGK